MSALDLGIKTAESVKDYLYPEDEQETQPKEEVV